MGVRSTINDHAGDVRMLRRLRALFASDGRIPRLDVDVDVENGVVELLGVIPDEQEHDALLSLAAIAAGRKPVTDHLILAKTPRPRRKKRRPYPQAKRD